jgi:hypothetical protein
MHRSWRSRSAHTGQAWRLWMGRLWDWMSKYICVRLHELMLCHEKLQNSLYNDLDCFMLVLQYIY